MSIKRKPNRLKEYNYSQNGAYFITICTIDRKCIFGTVVQKTNNPVGAAICRPKLSRFGALVEAKILLIPQTYEGVYVDYYVVMPNHIHIIIFIDALDHGRQAGRNAKGALLLAQASRIAAPTISRIIGNFKRAVSIEFGFSPWQKSFHDHIIRNDADYNLIAECIQHNPARWREDRYYTL